MCLALCPWESVQNHKVTKSKFSSQIQVTLKRHQPRSFELTNGFIVIGYFHIVLNPQTIIQGKNNLDNNLRYLYLLDSLKLKQYSFDNAFSMCYWGFPFLRNMATVSSFANVKRQTYPIFHKKVECQAKRYDVDEEHTKDHKECSTDGVEHVYVHAKPREHLTELYQIHPSKECCKNTQLPL